MFFATVINAVLQQYSCIIAPQYETFNQRKAKVEWDCVLRRHGWSGRRNAGDKLRPFHLHGNRTTADT
jgi:hypothetical protein